MLALVVAVALQSAYVRAQPESTASLLARFQAADGAAAKEQLLNRIAERGGEAGKGLLSVAQTTGDLTTRWLAIRGLGMMKFEAAAPFLLDSLRSSEPYVRANAARALGELRYTAAADALIDLLKTETYAGATEQTALALGMIGARKAIPVLMSRISSVSSLQTKCWLLDSIGRLGSDAELSFVAQYLYGSGMLLPECAARALDTLAHGAIGLPPPRGLYDPSINVKKAREWWESRK